MPVEDRVLPVTVADVEAAAQLLEPVIRRTPVVRSRALSDLLGGPVYLKCENQQRAGSFKIRGAYTRMARLSDEEKARGVVAASAGNHAQGVALAARLLGIESRVYMPVGAPLPKLDATRGYGAEVVLTGSTVDECLSSALAHAESSGAVMIHPFDHPDVVAGQGTIALELLEQQPEVKTVLVSTGGGGLLAGVATVIKARRPDIRVIGVQAQTAAAYPPSLAAGKPESLPSMSTMADGIAVGRPGDVPFTIVDNLVDEVVTVDEETISRALILMLERQKLLIEPAGAVAVAALLGGQLEIETPALAVLSGGNVDPLLLMRLIRHGLASSGRYLRLQVRVPDSPGSLAALLMRLATTDANVMEVEHVRTGPHTPVNEVEVALWLETRGPAHCEQVVADLTAAGYQPQRD
ncbi:threonine ammonia-lyase [Kineosporia mesophila]|uniref:threonine ammonia-lyase n=1 Tax=Kineosporia mesophila TaxID=566012 RepID=A0ABP6ZNB0_9ACTN|nr:threonine ammonia-lyase [Kineosporia mesophila]MCD5353492.1 threonine ammonia-lyase [Kineosporia mesophila]